MIVGSLKKEEVSKSPSSPKKPSCYLEKVCLKPKPPKEPVKTEPIREHESFTYRVVARNRERREARLKENFQAKGFQNLEENSTRTHLTESNVQEVVSRNIPKHLNKPVAHFVEHANKPQLIIDQYHGNQAHH